MLVIFDLLLFLLISVSWVAVVIIIGWPLKRFLRLPDRLASDTILLLILFLLNALSIFDPNFQETYDASVLLDTVQFLPVAFGCLYWVHRGKN